MGFSDTQTPIDAGGDHAEKIFQVAVGVKKDDSIPASLRTWGYRKKGGTVELSKQDAEMHQLNVAIRLFLAGDYLASLTLSGAAEDIFAGLCRRKGLLIAADCIAHFHVNDTDPALTNKERRGVVFKVMNRHATTRSTRICGAIGGGEFRVAV